jgi:hypothetical protein
MTLKMTQDASGRVMFTIPDPTTEGLNLLTCQMPPDWRPTPIAAARIGDALMSTVEPRDDDGIPIAEVFHLVAHLTTDVLLKLAQAQAQLGKSQAEASEARQKLLANEAQANLEKLALVRAFIRYEQQLAIKSESELHPYAVANEVVEALREVLDQMHPRPDNAEALTKLIRTVGSTWQ